MGGSRGLFCTEGEIGGALGEVEEIAFEVGEKLDLAVALGGAGWFGEHDAALFQFGAGGGEGGDAQGQVAEAGEFVVAAFGERGLGGVEFQPGAAGEFDEAGQGVLAVLPNGTGTEDAFVPVFQGQRVGGGNGDVFEGKVHGGGKIKHKG